MDPIQFLADLFGDAQQALFEGVVQPVVFALGFGGVLEDAYTATGWLLVGIIQVAILLAVIGPLQRAWPAEPMVDRAAVRTDIIYTLIQRLGLFRLALFFSIDPVWDALFGNLRIHGLPTWQLDQAWPGVSDVAWISFALYLLVFDFVEYWLHRGQHGLTWWWSLHSLHHSQRQMTMWSDNRNHLLDDLIHDSAIVIVARLIGIAPGQFVAVIACTQLIENLSHANLRVWFGPVFERLLVSPRFHRMHHSIGLGHESYGKGTLGGHNFAVLFPIWDYMFGTANFERRYDPTGIRDQLPEEGGRDYGKGYWAQQRLGIVRLFSRAQSRTESRAESPRGSNAVRNRSPAVQRDSSRSASDPSDLANHVGARSSER